MLLPTTSMNVWCDRRPVTAANIERSMLVPLFGLRVVVAFVRSAVSASERRCCTSVTDASGTSRPPIDELRSVGGDVDAGDDAGRGLAVAAVLFERPRRSTVPRPSASRVGSFGRAER